MQNLTLKGKLKWMLQRNIIRLQKEVRTRLQLGDEAKKFWIYFLGLNLLLPLFVGHYIFSRTLLKFVEYDFHNETYSVELNNSAYLFILVFSSMNIANIYFATKSRKYYRYAFVIIVFLNIAWLMLSGFISFLTGIHTIDLFVITIINYWSQ